MRNLDGIAQGIAKVIGENYFEYLNRMIKSRKYYAQIKEIIRNKNFYKHFKDVVKSKEDYQHIKSLIKTKEGIKNLKALFSSMHDRQLFKKLFNDINGYRILKTLYNANKEYHELKDNFQQIFSNQVVVVWNNETLTGIDQILQEFKNLPEFTYRILFIESQTVYDQPNLNVVICGGFFNYIPPEKPKMKLFPDDWSFSDEEDEEIMIEQENEKKKEKNLRLVNFSLKHFYCTFYVAQNNHNTAVIKSQIMKLS